MNSGNLQREYGTSSVDVFLVFSMSMIIMINDVAFLKIWYDLGKMKLKRSIHVTYIVHIDFTKVTLMAMLA